ncbi:MAG: winged helix-turn-helix domain-containing protein [Rhodomicrobium sp.]
MDSRARQESIDPQTPGHNHGSSGNGGGPPALPEVLQIGDISLDAANYRVTRGVREVHMGPTELSLLAFMMQNAGKLLTRQQLRLAAWGEGQINPRTVDVYVGRLRKSLNRGRDRDPIRTVRHAGYMFALNLEKRK